LKGKLLIIDDEKVFCGLLERYFKEVYEVTAFTDSVEAARYIRGNETDVVLTDLSMPEIGGMEILNLVKAEADNTDIIIMTAYAKIDTAVEAMKKGAYDFIVKPFTTEELSLLLKNVFKKRKLSEENVNLRAVIDSTFRPENIIGESEEMKKVYQLIERVSKTDFSVLITGESGTGKELAAKALHLSSRRKEDKFVSINCSAIPETLLESELFGFVKGAFTGADKVRKGLFEYADGGTIFLDEIADAPLAIQAKLLRVLDEKKMRPLGSDREISVDVRVICATNRDLENMIRERTFREDLYFRINVVRLHLPPLLQRREDIPLLAVHFLRGRKKMHHKAFTILDGYGWPGNVRELKNLMDRLVVFTKADTIMPEDLSSEILIPSSPEDSGMSYNEAKRKITDEFNRTIINKYLLKHDGNVTMAAKELGMYGTNLQRLMKKYQISSKDFKR
jgi:DNA-binding NtrC family response regulator